METSKAANNPSASDKVSSAFDKVRDTVVGAQDSISAGADAVRKRSADANEFVTEKPWQAVGIAAAVAFAIGYLLAGRDKPRID